MVDATVGAGGHAEALLRGGVATVIGVDRDATALREASERLASFGTRFRAVRARFSGLTEALGRVGVSSVGGAFFDLGVSSMQLDRPERGFSYRGAGPLDMRMDDDPGPTAADVVNDYPEDRLANVIFELGGERRSRSIGRARRDRRRSGASAPRRPPPRPPDVPGHPY